MYSIKKINSKNLKEIEFVYKDFYVRAFEDFGFEISPLNIVDVGYILDQGFLNILALFEENDKFAKGILIYSTQFDIVELSVIHCPSKENIIERKCALLEALKKEIKDKDFSLISYPMLGIQSDFVRKIAHYGFDFVGQAIVNFKFDNEKSFQIFDKVANRKVPKGYQITNWDDSYSEAMVELIKSAFDGMQDSKFDPRFKTIQGCEDIIEKITKNIYGDFLPEHTKILLKDGKPMGFCMVNLTTPSIANIPIIGVHKELKGQGLGSLLLQEALSGIIKKVMKGQLSVVELNATTDTDNYAAIKMYRTLGFKEATNYPQAYCNLK